MQETKPPSNTLFRLVCANLGNLLLSLFLTVTLTSPKFCMAAPSLRSSSNGHYLVDSSNTPFFWLGDTAWYFLARLSRNDFDFYFADRDTKGFSVIQTGIITGKFGNTENFYGHKPFSIEGDLASHNEAYFQNVDYFIDAAQSRGLYVALFPLFLGIANTDDWLSNGTEAFEYGKWLGNRYRTDTNIIWTLGGDITPDVPNNNYVTYWGEMARGIAVGVNDGVNPDYTKCTITYHPSSYRNSSYWYHNESWEDFNGVQTYAHATTIYSRVSPDYALTPAKPTLLLEPEYEYSDQPTYKYTTPTFNRRQAYWAFFSGAAGYTFGCGPIWRVATTPPTWQTALNWDGSNYMARYKQILGATEWWRFIPDQSAVSSSLGNGDLLITAARSSAGNEFMVYVPVLANPGTVTPRSVTVNMTKVTTATTCSVKWIYPATGAQVNLGTFPNTGTRAFTTPSGWEDALLSVSAIVAQTPSAPRNLAVRVR